MKVERWRSRQRSGAAYVGGGRITLEELAEIMADELQLPRIEPKGSASISQE